MTDPVADHYRRLLFEHGDSPEAAQYSSRESQERRFAQLAAIADLRGTRVLDFGCGTAHLASYLEQRGIHVQYTGVDVVDEFFAVAGSKHPRHRFGRIEDFAGERFDFCLVSGVFNNKRNDSRDFYEQSLRKLFALCERGIAFNMMSTYVDFQDPGLFYEQPERAFEFVKRSITPYVTLRHDYEVKSGVIPFEFAIYAYRSAAG